MLTESCQKKYTNDLKKNFETLKASTKWRIPLHFIPEFLFPSTHVFICYAENLHVPRVFITILRCRLLSVNVGQLALDSGTRILSINY